MELVFMKPQFWHKITYSTQNSILRITKGFLSGYVYFDSSTRALLSNTSLKEFTFREDKVSWLTQDKKPFFRNLLLHMSNFIELIWINVSWNFPGMFRNRQAHSQELLRAGIVSQQFERLNYMPLLRNSWKNKVAR